MKKHSESTELSLLLDRFREEERKVKIFLRNDDVDQYEDTLRRLLSITLSHDVPLNLEIIPKGLQSLTITLLEQHKAACPNLFELNQHGWMHLNHEKGTKKSEFGDSRTAEQQFSDISKGKNQLEEIFGDKFYPLFTPPWNRCTEDTLEILDQLRFKGLSRDMGGYIIHRDGFQEISTTLDIFNWKSGAKIKTRPEILKELIFQIKEFNIIGILLHHKVMDKEAFSLLDTLLEDLCKYNNVKFYTFQSLLNMD